MIFKTIFLRGTIQLVAQLEFSCLYAKTIVIYSCLGRRNVLAVGGDRLFEALALNLGTYDNDLSPDQADSCAAC